MRFYGVVRRGESSYKPFFRTESLDEAKCIKGNNPNVEVLAYEGYKRTTRKYTTYVIKKLAE